MTASKCGGEGPSWIDSEPAVYPPDFVCWNYEWAPAGALPLLPSDPFFVLLSPPDPPPRPSCA